MTNKPRHPSFDVDDGRLDLDKAEAFDPDVTIPTAAAATAEPAAGTAPPPGDGADIDDLGRERDRLRDLLLRQAAEFDNYRKRVERERREQADQTILNFLEQLLAIVDDFERALRTDPREEPDAYRKGVDLIHRQLLELLRRRGVTPMTVVGEDFDPHLHQAVSQEPSSSHRDGEVIEELRRGYVIGDRLLRPAMVKVAKAS